jgi:hypothetical protein
VSQLKDLTCTEISKENGIETLYVHGATVSLLSRFLSQSVPWIWISDHLPKSTVQWWKTASPLNENNFFEDAEYRLVQYDMMLQTSRFLNIVPELEDFGVRLVQTHNRMPDTLVLDRIPENQQLEILKKNGAFLHFYLPHAQETAQVQCF